MYAVDDKVSCNFRGKGKWYGGKVIKVREDDTFDVIYEDGDKELRVPLARMRAFDIDLEKVEQLSQGLKVEARYQGKSKYFPGTIATMNEDGTFTVHYTSGEIEDNVTRDLVRIMEAAGENQEVFEAGDEVEGNFKNAGKWFKGKIIKRHSAGTYNLVYDDGDREVHVPVANIRRVNGSLKQQGTGNTTVKKDVVPAVVVGEEEKGERFQEKQRVECNYKGQGQWYPGEISMYREDEGTYNVEFDDVKLFKAYKVPAKWLREEKEEKIKEGDRVECNHKGLGEWHIGIISSIREDEGTYNVEFDNSDLFKAYKIPAKWLRLVTFKEGNRVEVNDKGLGVWHKGSISFYREDEGTYNVEFDDIDLFKAYKVPTKWMRHEGTLSTSPATAAEVAVTAAVTTSAGDDTTAVTHGTKSGDDTRDAAVAEKTAVASPAKPNLSGVKAAAAKKAAAAAEASQSASTTINKQDNDPAKEIATFLQSEAVGLTAEESKKVAEAAVGRDITSMAHLERMVRVVDFSLESIHLTKEQGDKMLAAFKAQK